ncbi:MAG: ComEC/Rec2 family competence protein [Myxococcota bacterium]
MAGLLLLLGSYAAGILWVDRGGATLPFGAVAAIGGLFGGAAAIGLVRGLAVGRGAGVTVRCLLRMSVIAALSAVAFAAGQHALDRELARARRGAAAVVAAAPGSAGPSRAERGPARLVDAVVVERRATGFGEEVELWDVRGGPGTEPLPERAVLAWRRDEASGRGADEASSRAGRLLWPGTRVRIAIRLEPLRPTRNPGSADRERAFARRGIGARARLAKPDWVVETVADDQPGARLRAGLVAARRAAAERVRRRLPGEVAGAGLARALVLGDRRDLSESTRHAFRELGLSHLLSVSGLHIGFVALPAAAALARLRVVFRRRGRPVRGFAAPIVAGGVAALGYAWLTGSSVPALRSGLAFGLFGLARALRVRLTPGPVLAVVALGLLVADPNVLFDPGARFSFTACAALVGAGLWRAAPARGSTQREAAAGTGGTAPAAEGRTPPWDALVDPMRASLAVSLGLLPWVELEGLPRSLPSPLVNALAIPWAGFVVLPGAFAACALTAGLPPGRGEFVLDALLWPAAALEDVAAGVGAFIASSGLTEDRPGVWPWPLGLIGIALGFAALRCGRVALAGLVWLGLGGLGLVPLREQVFAHERPRVVFFDVGQADAALVETKDAAWLIDTGPGAGDGSGGGTLLRALRALSVDRLDGLVITHADLDHRGGAPRLLAAMPIGELWLPALARAEPALEELATEARARGVRVAWVAEGDRLGTGRSLGLEVLWPPEPSGAGPVGAHRGPGATDAAIGLGGRNEQSIVLRATVGGRVVLFMADVGLRVEQRLLEAGRLGPVELLKLGHHGSRASSGPGLLAAVAPALAIVSAPCDARRGLPSPEALARVRDAGIPIAWTGRDGAIGVGWTVDGDRRTSSWGGARDCGGEGTTGIRRRRGPIAPSPVSGPDR